MSKNLKSPRTFEQQIEKLRSHGMNVSDESLAIEALSTRNYYRLTGYAYHLRDKENQYLSGTDFDTVLALYDFDRILRAIILESLEPIEIWMRTQVAYHFSLAFGSDGHYNPANFENSELHAKFIYTLDYKIKQNKDALFVRHHNRKYGGRLPPWVAVEILSFTDVSKFFANLHFAEKNCIAESIGQPCQLLGNWMHALCELRNVCAHFSRVYNREFSKPVKLGKNFKYRFANVKNNRVFARLLVMYKLFPDSDMRKRFLGLIEKLISEHAAIIDKGECLGFPLEWKQCFII